MIGKATYPVIPKMSTEAISNNPASECPAGESDNLVTSMLLLSNELQVKHHV